MLMSDPSDAVASVAPPWVRVTSMRSGTTNVFSMRVMTE